MGTDDLALADLRLTFRQLDKEGMGSLTTDQFLEGLREKMDISDKEEVEFRTTIMPTIDLDLSDTVSKLLFDVLVLNGKFIERQRGTP